MLGPRITFILAVMTGVTLELSIHAATGRREAWDSPVFWTTGLPIVIGVSFLIGLFSKRVGWLGTVAIAPSQVMTMMLRSGEIGNLWPLTVVVSTVLSAPFVAASFIGANVRPARAERSYP
jgi:hypothetical protein